MATFDPGDVNVTDPQLLFTFLSTCLTLNRLVETKQWEEAQRLIRESDPRIVSLLYGKVRSDWAEFIAQVNTLDNILRIFGRDQHEALVSLVKALRPTLIEIGERVSERVRALERGEIPTSLTSPTVTLSDEENSKVEDILKRAGLDLKNLLGG